MVNNHPYTRDLPLLFLDILKQPHTLIAGASGSGKSVLVNGLIYAALFSKNNRLILIDPKRVELHQYKPLPHTIMYASEPTDIIKTIHKTVDIMERRYKYMSKHGLKKSLDPETYVIVDEFADLMTTLKRETLLPLCRIAQLGRAANIHLIIATQRPTKDIVNGQIKVNIDSRIALRCPSSQDSRNIINVSGAELLPAHGKGLYLTPETLQPVLVDIPYIQETEINNLIKYLRRK